MQLDPARPAPILRDDIGRLLHLVGRFRWRLGLERTALFAVRGVGASALALVSLSVAAWVSGLGLPGVLAWLWILALPLSMALLLSVLRWPSDRQAALAADRHLLLEERLATAVELAARPRSAVGAFDGLQVRDAIERGRAARPTWLALNRHARDEALGAAALIVLAAASLILTAMPPPSLPETSAPGSLPNEVTALDEPERTTPPEAVNPASAEEVAVPRQQADPNLAERVQQQTAEREALDRLAQALNHVSAGQPAADAIQRGDFSEAKQQLTGLAEEADQLSDAAKQQLARDLQQAANATTSSDRQLADRERQASQALNRNNYGDQRQALRNLADQVERSGARSAPANQLARDVGRLQQQSPPNQAAASSAAQQQQGAAQQGGPPNAGASSQAGADANGQQGGQPGVGTGTSPDTSGDQAAPLDTAGQKVEVPTSLSNGPGVRPTDGTEDQVGNDPNNGTRGVSEAVRAQQTGQVAPEQNLVPGEQRPIVRGYFK